MLPILQIGPLAIQLPQLSILIAIWLGLWLTEKNATSYEISGDTLYNLVFTGLISGLVGARLIYAAQYPSAFIQSPLSLLSVNTGLMNIPGGFVVGLLGMAIFGQGAKIPFWNTLDALTPFLGVVAIGIAFAHVASGESFGSPTDLPWGIYLWSAKRQPSQIYELLSAAFILGGLMAKIKTFNRPGTLFLTFAALAAGSQLFLEAFHGDSISTIGGIRVVQIVSWCIMATALFLLQKPYPNPVTTPKG